MPLAEVGPKNARTDPNTGLRFYTWQGVEYPSVTTIRRMAGTQLPAPPVGHHAGREPGRRARR